MSRLVKWTGWSLIAPRPGRRIRPYPDSTTPTSERAKLGLIQEERVDQRSAADTHANGTPITRNVSAAPGSLPRLRFGKAYRMRARLVDLAGNSLAFDDRGVDKLEEASEPISYLRYEPLDAPVLSLRERVSEGESLERMVIRSNFDANRARTTWATRPMPATYPPKPALPTRPRTSATLCRPRPAS